MVTGSSFSPYLWHYSASLSHKGNCCQSILHDAVNDITCVSHALHTQYGIESVVCNHICHAVSSYHSHTVLIKHHISLKGMLLCLFVGFHRCNIRSNIILADIIRNFRLISAAFFIRYIRRSSMKNPAHFSLNTYGVFLPFVWYITVCYSIICVTFRIINRVHIFGSIIHQLQMLIPVKQHSTWDVISVCTHY